MCADTTVQEEEEEDPSDGKSDYASDEDAILSDLSFGNSFTSSFSPITNTNGGAYNQVNQEELQSDFNIPYNKGDSPTSLSPLTASRHQINSNLSLPCKNTPDQSRLQVIHLHYYPSTIHG